MLEMFRTTPGGRVPPCRGGMPERRRRRKGLASLAVCLAVLAAILLTPVGQPAARADTDADSLVFVTQHFPPYSTAERFGDEGLAGGPVADIIGQACQRMKVHCVVRRLPWARAQQQVRDGRADGIFLIGRSPEREAWLHFCPPLVQVEYGFFVRSDNPLQYAGPKDVAGYSVSVYGPSLASEILAGLAGRVPIVQDVSQDNEAGFLKLAQGRIDAVFGSKDNGMAVLADLRIANLRYAGWHNRANYCIALSRRVPPEVVAAFEKALWQLYREGTMQRILSGAGLRCIFPGDERP